MVSDMHNMPSHLGGCLSQWSRDYKGRVALVTESGMSLSYTALQDRVECLAGGLYRAGLRAGDRAMMQMPNTIGFVTVFFALLRLGAIPVMAMPGQREQDIDALMVLAEPAAYFVVSPDGPDGSGHDTLALAQKMRDRHKSLRLIIMDGNPGDLEDVYCLDDLHGPVAPWPEAGPKDTALLLLSGGTTGTPKLIPRKSGDYFYNFTESAKICGFDASTVFLAVLPAAHNFTLGCPGLLGTLFCGGRVVLSQSASCDEAMPLIERERVTHLALVPPLARLWVEARDWEESDLSSLQVVMVGGARLEADLARQIMTRLGGQLQQVFGMAEGLLCYTRLDDPLETIIHTQGRPLSPEDEIRIIDAAGKEIEEGRIGELLTRGPYTIRGYYRADAQNALSFTEDGFYRSGDLVRRDAKGNLIVEGRIKEQINRCGEKIPAAEVEEALNALPEVQNAVVAGVPDPLLGERICAFVKPSGAAINAAEIRATLRKCGLSDYKIPDQIETVSQWPLTAAGKIDRRVLVKHVIAQHYREEYVPVSNAPLELAVKLAESVDEAMKGENYILYERQGEWALAVGCALEIIMEADGTVWRSDGMFWKRDTPGQSVAAALADLPFGDWRAYGTADFEFACLTWQVENNLNPSPLFRMTIPRSEFRISPGKVLLRSLDAGDLARQKAMLHAADNPRPPRQGVPVPVDVRATGRDQYQNSVASSVAEMQARHYQKVILSRRVAVPARLDMQASYYAGRRENTPARSFLLKHGAFRAYGFSPEIVVTVDAQGKVTTQPLAGTRALTGQKETDWQLRKELESDTKEIAEHAISVKLAVEEMSAICQEGSVIVDAFMTVLERGSVQHLASHVQGVLAEGATGWDAFEKLFPAVTASGIPKKEALESIIRHENCARGLYSGSVLMADSHGALDAALVLRSAYQDGAKCWLQAGAGLVSQSLPEREFEETSEKMSSVGLYLHGFDD